MCGSVNGLGAEKRVTSGISNQLVIARSRKAATWQSPVCMLHEIASLGLDMVEEHHLLDHRSQPTPAAGQV